MNDFLPKDYDKNEKLNDTGSGYMKFEQGENKFRILASAIVGWEWWEDKPDGTRTPKRVKIDEKIDISKLADPDSVKRFWAFPVWNYKLEKIQILEVTQKGIQATIRGLSKSSDWGTPIGYDLSVIKEGEKLLTKYEVVPSPPKPLDKEIDSEFKSMYLNLEALKKGDDPFKKEISNEEADTVASTIASNTG